MPIHNGLKRNLGITVVINTSIPWLNKIKCVMHPVTDVFQKSISTKDFFLRVKHVLVDQMVKNLNLTGCFIKRNSQK